MEFFKQEAFRGNELCAEGSIKSKSKPTGIDF